VPGEAAGHGHDGGDVDHWLRGSREGLVVADQAAVLGEPREASFDHPTTGVRAARSWMLAGGDDQVGQEEAVLVNDQPRWFAGSASDVGARMTRLRRRQRRPV
jgi:hypothetical protein